MKRDESEMKPAAIDWP